MHAANEEQSDQPVGKSRVGAAGLPRGLGANGTHRHRRRRQGGRPMRTLQLDRHASGTWHLATALVALGVHENKWSGCLVLLEAVAAELQLAPILGHDSNHVLGHTSLDVCLDLKRHPHL